MNEKALEKKLRDEIKAIGGLALKFSSPYYSGMPDRIVLMPGGKISFVELKTTGKKTSPLQDKAIEQLLNMGFNVYIVDDYGSLNSFLEEVNR